MRLSFLVGGPAGLAAAVIWSVTLAVYQPLMEPHGVWTDPSTGAAYPVLGDNNTYWPRDIRQLAILLAFAAIVLICSASRRGIAVGAAGAGLWVAADLVLDRLDTTSLAPLMIAGIVWFGLVATVAARGATAPANPVVRTIAATVTAVLAPAAMIVTTPWEEPVTDPDRVRIENALSTLQIGLVVLALAVAVGIAGTTARALAFVGVAGVGATLAALAPYQTLGTVFINYAFARPVLPPQPAPVAYN